MSDQQRLPRKISPRIIRLRDAPAYLGMNRNLFNECVRTQLTELPIGEQGVGFDRIELDAWVDNYVVCNRRPGRKGAVTWDANLGQVSSAEGRI